MSESFEDDFRKKKGVLSEYALKIWSTEENTYTQNGRRLKHLRHERRHTLELAVARTDAA